MFKILKSPDEEKKFKLIIWIDHHFNKLKQNYEKALHDTLNYLPVAIVFAIIILFSNYFLFTTSKSELAPQEDQGIIIAQVTAPANASLAQTQLYSNQVSKVFSSFPETDHIFQLDGANGLNISIIGMVFKTLGSTKTYLQSATTHNPREIKYYCRR